MVSAGLIRKNAAAVIKKILPQCTAVTGIFCLFSLLGVFFGQLFSLFFPASIRTEIILALSAIFNIFLVTPLTLGIQRWAWRLTGGADDSLRTILYAFGDGEGYRRALGFSLRYNLRLYALQLAGLPALLLEKWDASSSTTGVLSDVWGTAAPVLSAAAALLELIGGIFCLWLTLRYFLAPYLLSNDETLSPAQALRLSFKMMSRRAGGLLGFFLSFIGWGLLCLLVLPVMYVLPLIWISGAIYARYLIADYNSFYMTGGILHA